MMKMYDYGNNLSPRVKTRTNNINKKEKSRSKWNPDIEDIMTVPVNTIQKATVHTLNMMFYFTMMTLIPISIASFFTPVSWVLTFVMVGAVNLVMFCTMPRYYYSRENTRIRTQARIINSRLGQKYINR